MEINDKALIILKTQKILRDITISKPQTQKKRNLKKFFNILISILEDKNNIKTLKININNILENIDTNLKIIGKYDFKNSNISKNLLNTKEVLIFMKNYINNELKIEYINLEKGYTI